MLLEMVMWTLITVTNGGTVHESQFTTKHSAEEAKSIALTGMTIEENEKADSEYAAWLKKWEEDHTWRDPKDDFERRVAKTAGTLSWGGPYQLAGDGNGRVREIAGGGLSMSYNPNNGESVEWIRGRAVLRYKNDIKYAKIVPPDQKE